MSVRVYRPPRHELVLASENEKVQALAQTLWTAVAEPRDLAPGPRRVTVTVDVFDGDAPPGDRERLLSWTSRDDTLVVVSPKALEACVDLGAGVVRARVASALLDDDPAFVARVVLEACTAPLFQREAYQVLHAGAVAGQRGAVVIRGAAGAGKSTLVAAMWKEGYRVLADESLFVAREDTDELVASVRDLTLRPDSARLLALPGLAPAFVGGEEKRRVDLFSGSAPADRIARRTATVLLGPRDAGPVRLVTLSRDELRAEFRRGEIPQERNPGDPDRIGLDWFSTRCFRLDGATDLEGAVGLLRSLAGPPASTTGRT